MGGTIYVEIGYSTLQPSSLLNNWNSNLLLDVLTIVCLQCLLCDLPSLTDGGPDDRDGGPRGW